MKENVINTRAQEFLINVSDDELEELVNSDKLEVFQDNNHITQRLVRYCFEEMHFDFAFKINFIYPQIAKEAFRRYKQYRQHFDKLAEDYEISRNNGRAN